jgi:hypothetical protein
MQWQLIRTFFTNLRLHTKPEFRQITNRGTYMKLLAYIRTVLWSFFGIGSRASNREDLSKVKPLGLLVVAAVILDIFGFSLFGLANLAMSTLQ